MKKVYFLLLGIGLGVFGNRAAAQSFTVQYDTVYGTPAGGLITYINDITPGPSPVTIQWHVTNSNFPSDWLPAVGICDDSTCYANGTGSLYPGMATKTSKPYAASTAGNFDMQIDLDGATTLGTYYMRVKLWNQAVPTDSAIQVYVISKLHPTNVPTTRSLSDFSLYPNPATNEVNVVFDASADVKNIAVFNIIGKMAAIYKVNGNSANLNLDNIPSGIYFVRLVNSQGNVIGTKKFSKQ